MIPTFLKYERWKQYQNYVIIAVLSITCLFFFPMLGTELGVAWRFPTTPAGWTVFIITKLSIAAINMLIFHCFVQQAKVNSLTHPNYVMACEILNKVETCDIEKPKSPKEYFAEVYGKKGIFVFLTSALSAIGLTQAVLTFDLVSMLTYLFTILVGVIAGLIEMSKDELYWQETYLRYAKNEERKEAERNANKTKMELEVDKAPSPNETNDTPDTSGGVAVLESIDSLRALGTYR